MSSKSLSQSYGFVILLLTIIGAFCFADVVPYKIKSFSYALSLSIKEVLIFILPFVVFSIIFHSLGKLQGGSAVKMVSLLFLMVLISNSLSTGTACLIGHYLVGTVQEYVVHDSLESQELLPFFNVPKLPTVISVTWALAAGFLCGIILPKVARKSALKLSETLYKLSILMLSNVFSAVLPIFVLGLTFKMKSDGAFDILKANYEIIIYIFSSCFAYTTFLYWIGNGASFKKTVSSLKNMVPAVFTAFCTMSSLITMPVTLNAVKKSINDPDIADISVPGSVNIHLVGDCFFTVIFMTILLSVMGTETVTTSDYIHFLASVVLMKFAEAAVAGTGLVLMFPAMEHYLHCSPAMISLTTTLCIILDPIFTVANVFGNGAFSILFAKVSGLLLKRSKNRPVSP